MASFFIGIFAGCCTGTYLRQEYTFPTTEKIMQAFDIFKSNEKVHQSESRPTDQTSQIVTPSTSQTSGTSSN